MLKARLGLWLGVLVALVATQFAVVVWLVNQSELERSRSLRAKDALVQYIALAADKQRLKVWFAQYLLTDQAPVALRDQYLQRMQTALNELERLHREEQADAGGLAGEAPLTRQPLDALQTNFRALRAQIQQAQPHIPHPNPSTERASVWSEMLSVFDISEGQDMRALIAQAITQQQAHSTAAEAAAQVALQRSRNVAIYSILSTIALSIGFVSYFAWDIRRRMRPLLDGTLALQAGQLEHRIGATGRDEFGRLGQSFNRMAEEIQLHRHNEETQRQRLETAVAQRTADLHQANAQLLEIDRSRRQFFANISHELRTPTTAILGEAEITLRRSGHAESLYRDALERVASIARQLGARIGELMAVARQSEAGLQPELSLIDLAEPLRAALEQVQATAAQQEHQLQWLNHTPAAEPLMLRGSLDKLTQLFTIVLDNALRYSPAGGQISVETQPAADGAEWQITISDTGIGMDAQELPRASERYWRSERARAMRPEGMGLGLTIAEDIVRAHGGQFSLKAREGGGTQVLIRLPAALSHSNNDNN
nr:HAMP domain-containing sensor histidine kinase [uncultured Roseateles sp.]